MYNIAFTVGDLYW